MRLRRLKLQGLKYKVSLITPVIKRFPTLRWKLAKPESHRISVSQVGLGTSWDHQTRHFLAAWRTSAYVFCHPRTESFIDAFQSSTTGSLLTSPTLPHGKLAGYDGEIFALIGDVFHQSSRRYQRYGVRFGKRPPSQSSSSFDHGQQRRG